MESKELAFAAAKALDARKGFDIQIIDIAGKSSFADYFVLASAKSMRQLQALAFETEDELAKLEICVRSIEGKGESGWILMDFGDVIINIFTEAQRAKYNIEKIWGDCPIENYIGEEK